MVSCTISHLTEPTHKPHDINLAKCHTINITMTHITKPWHCIANLNGLLLTTWRWNCLKLPPRKTPGHTTHNHTAPTCRSHPPPWTPEPHLMASLRLGKPCPRMLSCLFATWTAQLSCVFRQCTTASWCTQGTGDPPLESPAGKETAPTVHLSGTQLTTKWPSSSTSSTLSCTHPCIQTTIAHTDSQPTPSVTMATSIAHGSTATATQRFPCHTRIHFSWRWKHQSRTTPLRQKSRTCKM